MDTNTKTPDTISDAIKSYISPILLSIVGIFIWRDLSEVRSDVKLLLGNNGANQVKIENLQADVNTLKSYIYERDSGNNIHFSKTQPAKKEDEQVIN